MSIKLYATRLCIPRIQNYNGICTNDFLQPANNLQPPKKIVDGWFKKSTNIPCTTHRRYISKISIERRRYIKTIEIS